jgi:uncharacterized damage-inducible protein DinB
MKKLYLPVLAFAMAFSGVATHASGPSGKPAQSAAPAAMQSSDKTSPSYDLKGQAIVDLQGLQKQFVDLANAIPAEKYSWRPGEGVRSIGEVYLHIAAANHNIPTMMGAPKMDPYMAKDFQTSITEKQKIVDELNNSFTYAISLVQKMSNADFAKPEKSLGPDANDGDVVYILVTHAHEHLGQSIAYARINGIVPPWTAAAEAAAKKKAAAAPPDKD